MISRVLVLLDFPSTFLDLTPRKIDFLTRLNSLCTPQCYTMPQYLKMRFGGQRIRIWLAVIHTFLTITSNIAVSRVQRRIAKPDTTFRLGSLLIPVKVTGVSFEFHCVFRAKCMPEPSSSSRSSSGTCICPSPASSQSQRCTQS